MPHINVSMYPGRDDDTKQDLAVKLQDFLAAELKIGKEIVSVSVQDVSPEHWEAEMKKIPNDAMFVKPEK